MTRRIRRTSLAEQDYLEIYLHIAADNPVAAENVLRTFDEKLGLLLGRPGIGRARPELAPDLRHFPVGNYILFYREVPDGIELVRVIHGARDIPDIFDELDLDEPE